MDTTGGTIYSWMEDIWHNLWELMIFNLLWFLLSLPLVTAPPATAGLYYATNRLVHEKPTGWRTFFDGFRSYFWASWRWVLLNALVVGLIVSNLAFYRRFQAGWSEWVRGAVWGVGVLWAFIQVYTFPLLLEQTDQRVLTALRNSLVLYLKRPGLTLTVAACVLAIAFLCIMFLWPTWIVVTAGLCAYLATRTTVHLVAEFTGRQAAKDGEA